VHACAAGQRTTQESAINVANDPLAAPQDASAQGADTNPSSARSSITADGGTSRAGSAASAVNARAILRSADSADRWSTVAAMSAVGTRAALLGHMRAINRRRIAAMSAEERRRAFALHQERVRPGLRRSRVLRSAGGIGDSFGFGGLGSSGAGAGMGAGSASASPQSMPSQQSASYSNSITNNQVANVDEGDIVKASGDDLIILRRGHLFRVSTANNGLRPLGHTPAYPPNTRPGDWYDELLVDGDIALVLGYSYRANATEVNRFRLERGGAIRYLDSFYVRSDDYYSSENYATRLVNGRFVVYVPMLLEREDPWDERLRLPSVRIGRSGAFREPFDYSRVFVTSADRSATTLHTVLHCDIHGARVQCSAQGVMGNSSRTFYVSNSAVYVWTEPGTTDDDRRQRTGSWIVRMPLSQQHAPGAARVRGGPVDQFAFDERGNSLHVLLRDDGHGDTMWQAQASGGAVAALKIPLARLNGQVSDAPAESYTMITAIDDSGVFKERWVGEWALFGTGRSVYGHASGGREGQFFAYRASDQRLFEIQTDHGIERIEPMGAHALAVGNAGSTLVLTPVALDGASPETFAALRLHGRGQGESRSHGFFFKPSGARDGVFGIATAGRLDTGHRQLSGSSDVSFFRVSNLVLAPLGTIESRGSAAGRCSVSCADWYGNTRPIFWGSRVFALMGDELVEAAIDQRSLTERLRVDYGSGVEEVVAEEEEEEEEEE
jgi:hypothetical protein